MVDSLVKKRLKLNVIQTHIVKAIPISKSMIHGGVLRVQAVKETDGFRSLRLDLFMVVFIRAYC